MEVDLRICSIAVMDCIVIFSHLSWWKDSLTGSIESMEFVNPVFVLSFLYPRFYSAGSVNLVISYFSIFYSLRYLLLGGGEQYWFRNNDIFDEYELLWVITHFFRFKYLLLFHCHRQINMTTDLLSLLTHPNITQGSLHLAFEISQNWATLDYYLKMVAIMSDFRQPEAMLPSSISH